MAAELGSLGSFCCCPSDLFVSVLVKCGGGVVVGSPIAQSDAENGEEKIVWSGDARLERERTREAREGGKLRNFSASLVEMRCTSTATATFS